MSKSSYMHFQYPIEYYLSFLIHLLTQTKSIVLWVKHLCEASGKCICQVLISISLIFHLKAASS